MNNHYNMYKEAAGIGSAIKTGGRYIDDAVRGLGRLFGAGNKQTAKIIHQTAKAKKLGDLSVGKQYADDLAELTRLKRLNKADDLLKAGEKGIANAERIVGYTAAGVPIIAGVTAGVVSKAKKDAEESEGQAAENEFRRSLKRDQAKEALRQEQATQAAKDKEYNDKMWRNTGIVFGGSQLGGVSGALMDRRNRLRGYLLGSAVGAAVTGVGLHLHDKYFKG